MRPPGRLEILTHLALDAYIMSQLNNNLTEEAEQFIRTLFQLSQTRYWVPQPINTQTETFTAEDLHRLPAPQFKQLCQTTLPLFLQLGDMLKDNAIFQNPSQHGQLDPLIQIAVALARLGSNGNGSAIARIQLIFGISYGTVIKYTQRTVHVLFKVRKSYIKWPTSPQHTESSQVMAREGFPGCIGFVDGTSLPFSQKPAMHGNQYYDRKKRYVPSFDRLSIV